MGLVYSFYDIQQCGSVTFATNTYTISKDADFLFIDLT